MLSIIVPVLNEERLISAQLSQIMRNCLELEYEIVIVDDHSEDKTREYIVEAQKYNNNIKLIEKQNRRGLGRSIREGILHTSGNVIVFLMGDLSDDCADIKNMYDKIESKQCDVICASRYVQGGVAKHNILLKGIFSRLISAVTRYVFALPVHDVTNTFKMFRKEVYDEIGTLHSNYFTIGMELVVKAHKKGYRIAEIPTIWKDRKVGNSQFSLLRDGLIYCCWFIMLLFIKKKRNSYYDKK